MQKSKNNIVIVNIFYATSFWIIGFNESHFENSVPLKPELGGVAGVAQFITRHEKTQYNRVIILIFDVFFACKDLTTCTQNILTSLQLVLCRVAAIHHPYSPVHH